MFEQADLFYFLLKVFFSQHFSSFLPISLLSLFTKTVFFHSFLLDNRSLSSLNSNLGRENCSSIIFSQRKY